MRGVIKGIENPHPIGHMLPGIYQEPDPLKPYEDSFTLRFVSGFDEVLAPVFLTLDNLDAYFDPNLCPPDFLEWLSEWVGFALDERWSLERRRALVSRAVELYRWRGTVKGISMAVETLVGVVPEVDDNGAVAWSHTPGSPLPGNPVPSLRVRVKVPDPAEVNLERLEAIVSDSKPAHVMHTIEVTAA